MRYRFRAHWLPTLATLLLLPAFVALGMWQLGRADEKRALQAEYDRRAHQPPISLDGQLRRGEDLRFYRVVAEGTYEPERQILLDNRVHAGSVGYYVVTPLRLRDSDTRVLVNRGWVALGRNRAELPAVRPPAGVQRVTGIATVPLERTFTLGDGAQGTGWQAVWPYLDLARYRAETAQSLQPVVILLDPQSDGGYVRQWARLDAGIATHQGYAFQWFALALALVALYLFINIRRA